MLQSELQTVHVKASGVEHLHVKYTCPLQEVHSAIMSRAQQLETVMRTELAQANAAAKAEYARLATTLEDKAAAIQVCKFKSVCDAVFVEFSLTWTNF